MRLDNWSWIVGSWPRGWSSVEWCAVDEVEGTTVLCTITEVVTNALGEAMSVIAAANV